MEYIVTKKNQKIDNFLKKTKKELDAFFGFEVREPAVLLLTSRKQLDSLWERKTEKWEVGGTRTLKGTQNGIIFILSPEVYCRQSTHKDPKVFWKTLKHEYCHIYFQQITGSSRPIWFNEGLASYMAGQKKSGGNPMDVFDYFDIGGEGVYQVGYFWVNFLVENFGEKKIKQLANALRTRAAANAVLSP